MTAVPETRVGDHRVGGHRVGLPDGVFLAPLGRRLGAFAIDALVPYVLVVVGLLTRNNAPGWLTIIVYAVAACWLLLLLIMVALRAAGPGMQLLGLQIVGLHDGRPIGFGRALLRAVILGALLITGVGVIIGSTVMVLQPRRQGWHDHAVDSVVINERPLAPPRRRPTVTDRATADRATDAGQAQRSPDRVDQPPVDHEQPGSDQGWVVILDDGRQIAVHRLILIGRNPQPGSGEADARLIKIIDEARTVSKTHLAVSVDAEGITITDRGSMNGSAITAPDGESELLIPGQPRRLPGPGYLVSFGQHHIRIGRHD